LGAPPVAEGSKLAVVGATPATGLVACSPSSASTPATTTAAATTSTSSAGATATRSTAATAGGSETAPIVEAKTAIRAGRAESAHSQGIGSKAAVLHYAVAHQSQVSARATGTSRASRTAAAIHPVAAGLLVGRGCQTSARASVDQVRIAAVAGHAKIGGRFGSGQSQGLCALFRGSDGHVLEAGPLLRLLSIPAAPALRSIPSLAALSGIGIPRLAEPSALAARSITALPGGPVGPRGGRRTCGGHPLVRGRLFASLRG